LGYGSLPAEVPDIILPEIDIPDSLTALALLRAPFSLKKELLVIGKKLGSLSKAVAYNLHYELTGSGCISAAIPDEKKGRYVAFRRLEWTVGFEPRFAFYPLTRRTKVRQTAGYVGALSGASSSWHISMNYSPSRPGINVNALPVSWVIRHAIAKDRSYDATIAWLLKRQVVRGAYVTIVSKDRACCLHMDSRRSELLHEAEYPDVFVIGNDDYPCDIIPDDYNRHLSDVPYKSKPGDFTLDTYVHTFKNNIKK